MQSEPESFFEFPDEEWTEETQVLRGPERRGPPRIPIRLAGLVLAVLLLAASITASVNGCGGPSAAGQTRRYVGLLTRVASHSHALGSELAAAAATSAGAGTLAKAVDRLAREAAGDIAAVGELAPTGQLLDAQTAAAQALAFRLAGLDGIAAALGEPPSRRPPTDLLDAAQRLLASDVVWHDRVEEAIAALLRLDHITNVSAPSSVFLTNRSLATPAGVAALLARLAGTSPARPGAGNQTLKLGDRSPSVKRWQQLLDQWLAKTRRAEAPLQPDGNFGPATDALTRTFQTSAGLTPDGVVGTRTRQAMTASLGG